MKQVDQFKQTFFQECEELLGRLEKSLGALARGSKDPEQVNDAFRDIHSIKGGAGMFGLARLVDYTHAFETALNAARSGLDRVPEELFSSLLTANDVLSDLIHAEETGVTLEKSFESEMLTYLRSFCGGGPAAQEGEAQAALSLDKSDAEIQPSSGEGAATSRYCISFKPRKDMLRRAVDPLSILRGLKELGRTTVEPNLSELPAFADIDATALYLSWTITLETAAPLEEIKGAFEFASGSCDLEIVTEAEVAVEDPASVAEDAHLEAKEADVPTTPVEDQPREASEDARSVPQLASVPFPSSRTSTTAAPSAQKRLTSIRVDLDRVDNLVDLVGEIAIVQSMVLEQLDKSGVQQNAQVLQLVNQLLQQTRALQDGVMAIRAQPVRTVFERLPRVVREVTQQTGKSAKIQMDGGSTEIDKTIIEELSDPLVHIIRNCIDHGIETSEERKRRGKPVQGTINVAAAQKGSRIVIQVSDDGGGIDRGKVRGRAVEKGLIAHDAVLSDEEIDNLVFMPGLSTASEVSSISGRGVGMDVVQKNILKLGGRISIRSHPGQGTTTTLTLPLTLAVLDGMIVRAGSEPYVVPLGNIIECLAVSRSALKTIPGTGAVVNVRGQQVLVASLSNTLGLDAAEGRDIQQIVLVESENGIVAGLAVDEVVGQGQVVVKGIRDNLGGVTGFAGATILGDGGIALILDVSEVIRLAGQGVNGIFGDVRQCAGTGARVA